MFARFCPFMRVIRYGVDVGVAVGGGIVGVEVADGSGVFVDVAGMGVSVGTAVGGASVGVMLGVKVGVGVGVGRFKVRKTRFSA